MSTRKALKWSALGILGLLGVGLVAVCVLIGPRNVLGMLRYDQRSEGTLKVGDAAPDVALHALDGKGQVKLAASVGEQPLVVVFGSFT